MDTKGMRAVANQSDTSCELQCVLDSGPHVSDYEGSLEAFERLQEVPQLVEDGVDMRAYAKAYANPSAIRASGLLPFAFYRVWKQLDAIEGASFGLRRKIKKVQTSLVQAMTISCANAGSLAGKTAVLIDASVSMNEALDESSLETCRDVASVLGALITRVSDDAWVCACTTTARHLLFCGCNVLKDSISVPFVGTNADFKAGFSLLQSSDFNADRIVVVSNTKITNGATGNEDLLGKIEGMTQRLDAYANHVGHDVWLHTIDLQGGEERRLLRPPVQVVVGWREDIVRDILRAEAQKA